MTFDEQLEALKPHCRLKRAMITDMPEHAAWEVTTPDQYALYRLTFDPSLSKTEPNGCLYRGRYDSFDQIFDAMKKFKWTKHLEWSRQAARVRFA